ncbi:MAG TPA: aromatic ring-hydroxylating dioxygenase subunit alpha [Actinomycetes bacterium]|nr:aromatic ring-hydroxylating dioxygenase subunit alpha [Actinomycetes bacterium]
MISLTDHSVTRDESEILMTVTTNARHTLPAEFYYSQEQYDAEREQIWFENWVYIGRSDTVSEPGQFRVVDVAGESILVTRNEQGELRAFYNVCSHRGSRLCEEPEGTTKAVFQCPYHAWCYDLNGKLVVTPRVGEDEVDRSQLGLKPVYIDEWQGFLFVNLSYDEPESLRDSFDRPYGSPLRFERHELHRLVTVRQTESVVAANWKILVENYGECLHCPIVHPELVEIVPTYRSGDTGDRTRVDGGVLVTTGGTSYSNQSKPRPFVLPGMTEEQAHSIYGCGVFPNMFIDVAGSNVVATRLVPEGPTQTRVLTDYLFIPEDVATDDFDPEPVVEFCELVAGQDYAVSERVQRGITSRGFKHGVYPARDEYVHLFNEHYRAVMASQG